MTKFYYVYILQSEIDQKRFYTGFTEDLNARLESHNSGGCQHTSKYRPWRLKTAVAFGDRQKALDFEKYLPAVPLPKNDSKILKPINTTLETNCRNQRSFNSWLF
jgi:predicted GIY-YIG superfamily endonuclease